MTFKKNSEAFKARLLAAVTSRKRTPSEYDLEQIDKMVKEYSEATELGVYQMREADESGMRERTNGTAVGWTWADATIRFYTDYYPSSNLIDELFSGFFRVNKINESATEYVDRLIRETESFQEEALKRLENLKSVKKAIKESK